MKKFLNNRLELVVLVFLMLLIISPLIYNVFSFTFAGDIQSLKLDLEKPDKKYTECVKDTEYMRVNHMDLLHEIRDEVMREGKRGSILLNNCRGCHVSKTQFCNKCHNIVGVVNDCFSCHYYPE